MPKAILNQIINQLKNLEPSELQQLNQVVQQYLASQSDTDQKARFHSALLASGLVKQIKQPFIAPQPRHLILVKGEPVSETIIKERR